MSRISGDLRILLIRELETIAREVELFPDDESLWRTPPGVTNSCGSLAMHLAGNLQHFVGGILGSTGYVRDRDREFSQRSGTRAEIVAELRQAIDAVDRTLRALPETALGETFPLAVGGVHMSTQMFLAHLAVHAGFHLGQADYLRRILTGENRTAGTMALTALALS